MSGEPVNRAEQITCLKLAKKSLIVKRTYILLAETGSQQLSSVAHMEHPTFKGTNYCVGK